MQSPQLLACYSEVIDAQCNGDDSGEATIVGVGGTPPYTFLWCNGATDPIISGLPAGDCEVTVIDLNGCSVSIPIIINEPPVISIMTMSTDVSCAGANDGTAVVMATGGVGGFSYEWSNTEMVPDINNLSAGNFTVTATDANGCTAVESVNVNESASSINLTTTSTNIDCFSPDGGNATVTPNGGTAPYSYEWCDGSNNASANNLSPGTCCVTVSDVNGCSAETCVTINSTSSMALNITGTNELCAGDQNATAEVLTTGGTPPYTYLWCDGTTTANTQNLSNGQCCVTVTDATGCSTTACHSVQSPAILACISEVIDPPCFGDNGGIADIFGVGGTPPYSFLWCDGSSGSTALGLAPGECSVTVTDSNNCSTTMSLTINEPPALILSGMSTNLSCADANDGSAVIFATGGTGAYTYEWSNNETGPDINNLPAGNFTATVTDDAGCSITTNLQIESPEEMEISASTQNALCGGGNGAIDLSVNGGSTPYTYLWSNNSISSDLDNLPSGNYTVTITDINGCTNEAQFSISAPTDLNGNLVANNISCATANDGSLSLELSGGTAPFNYEWSTGGSNTSSLDNLPEGNYSVVVTDANDCSITFSESLSAPTEIAVNGIATNALCGEDSGTIQLDISGGTAPYTCLWSNGLTSEILSDLGPGNYIVTVTDNLGCTQLYQQEVEASSAISLLLTPNPISCNGIVDGNIMLDVIGGQSPFAYEWSSGVTTQNISNSSAGEYSVTVTDANNCFTIASATIEEPEILTAAALSPVNISCNGGNDGSIDLTVSGGTLPYSYDWDNAANLPNLSNLPPGTYTVTVTDSNNCTTVSTTTLTAPPALVLATSPTMASCADLDDAVINLMVTGGSPPFQYNWNTGATTANINAIGSGTYTVEVTDAQNCSAIVTETILSPEQISIDLTALSEYEEGNHSWFMIAGESTFLK